MNLKRAYVVGLCNGVALMGLMYAGLTWAQAPSAPPPTCEDQLDNAKFQLGELMKQSAILNSQLRATVKERDEARAAKVPEKK